MFPFAFLVICIGIGLCLGDNMPAGFVVCLLGGAMISACY